MVEKRNQKKIQEINSKELLIEVTTDSRGWENSIKVEEESENQK